MNEDRQKRNTSLRVRVSSEELAEIRKAAEADSRTVSQFVWMVLRERLTEIAEQEEATA